MNPATAWSIFWAEQGPKTRCLAGAWELSTPLDDHWRQFASSLPPTGRVIDLACGGGAVGRVLLTIHPQLRVTGVDIAGIPASGDPRLVLKPNVAIESLPFDGGAFDAAVSQFGYEYAESEVAAREVARVLQPGGRLSLLLHHPQSPIVEGMRVHQNSLRGLCATLTERAFLAGDFDALARRMADLKRSCAGDPIIDQTARVLQEHIHRDRTELLKLWAAVMEAFAPELVMLEALDRFKVGHDDVDHWVAPLSRAFAMNPPEVVRTATGRTVAWAIGGERLP